MPVTRELRARREKDTSSRREQLPDRGEVFDIVEDEQPACMDLQPRLDRRKDTGSVLPVFFSEAEKPGQSDTVGGQRFLVFGMCPHYRLVLMAVAISILDSRLGFPVE